MFFGLGLASCSACCKSNALTLHVKNNVAELETKYETKINLRYFLSLFRRGFLKDLIETTHMFLKMLEVYCKSNTHLVVQGKKRKKQKKRPRPAATENQGK